MAGDPLGNPCHPVTLYIACEHTEVKVLADHCLKDIIHQYKTSSHAYGCDFSKIIKTVWLSVHKARTGVGLCNLRSMVPS